jgi:hypothetical protein
MSERLRGKLNILADAANMMFHVRQAEAIAKTPIKV